MVGGDAAGTKHAEKCRPAHCTLPRGQRAAPRTAPWPGSGRSGRPWWAGWRLAAPAGRQGGQGRQLSMDLRSRVMAAGSSMLGCMLRALEQASEAQLSELASQPQQQPAPAAPSDPQRRTFSRICSTSSGVMGPTYLHHKSRQKLLRYEGQNCSGVHSSVLASGVTCAGAQPGRQTDSVHCPAPGGTGHQGSHQRTCDRRCRGRS